MIIVAIVKSWSELNFLEAKPVLNIMSCSRKNNSKSAIATSYKFMFQIEKSFTDLTHDDYFLMKFRLLCGSLQKWSEMMKAATE